jgi:hypothetical protein
MADDCIRVAADASSAASAPWPMSEK